MRATAPAASLRRRERGGILFSLLVLAFLLLLGLILYLARAPLLAAVGEWWVVNESFEKAQAAVVLGGDSVGGDRLQRGVRLYREGWAPQLVLVGPALRTYLNETQLMEREAHNLGVPADKILRVPQPSNSTLEDALLLRRFLAAHEMRRVIVVTSNFHARRTRRIFQKVLRPQGIQFWVVGVEDPRFEPQRWWRQREQRAVFFLELMRTIYTWWELLGVRPLALLRARCLLPALNVL